MISKLIDNMHYRSDTSAIWPQVRRLHSNTASFDIVSTQPLFHLYRVTGLATEYPDLQYGITNPNVKLEMQDSDSRMQLSGYRQTFSNYRVTEKMRGTF